MLFADSEDSDDGLFASNKQGKRLNEGSKYNVILNEDLTFIVIS